MFTKQHYIAVAEILKKNRIASDSQLSKDFRAMFWNENNNFDDKKWNDFLDS